VDTLNTYIALSDRHRQRTEATKAIFLITDAAQTNTANLYDIVRAMSVVEMNCKLANFCFSLHHVLISHIQHNNVWPWEVGLAYKETLVFLYRNGHWLLNSDLKFDSMHPSANNLKHLLFLTFIFVILINHHWIRLVPGNQSPNFLD